MLRVVLLCGVVVCWLSGWSVAEAGGDIAAETAAERRAAALFSERIGPLFAAKCGACHGETAETIEGAFDMRSRASVLAGGESEERAIDFGDVDESLLLKAIRWQDGWEMPPKENDRLTREEIAWVRTWVEAGAPWPEREDVSPDDPSWSEPDAEGKVRVRTSGGQSASWTNRRYEPADLWAYQPLKDVETPAGDDPVTAFVDARLAEARVDAASGAGRAELLRRVCFDLTGLPPTAGQRAAFLRDENPLSYDELVDELLASPHYGERMAQHWLDVTRYADSNGFSRDDFRPDAHEYRSYVIASFNDDKPFATFVREQIAGDQLKLAGQEALAFLWMGPWEQTAMSVAAVTRQQWLDDVVNSVGVTFLGQQLRCAKCHDHKFDPIPTRDYYQMQAVFADTKHHAGAGRFKIAKQRRQEMTILTNGSLEQPGEAVEAAALSVLTTTASHGYDTSIADRAALAEWIVSEKNPLTARVFVNRVWQMHFGRGLVATPNDFGKMGADPTHPELLDWLARWFLDHDGSVKKLHRLIVMSAVYRRSTRPADSSVVAERDPGNELLSYFPSRRLTAEEMRDAMLAITGELKREIGGPSVYPELNWEVAFQPRLAMGKLVAPYEPDPTPEQRHRRSIYAVRIRNLGHPLMEVFNRPGADLSCERRDETTVTPQVFTLMHGEFAHDRSIALAHAIAGEHPGDVDAQVVAVFERVLGRVPTREQLGAAVDHVREQAAAQRELTLTPTQVPTTVTLNEIQEKTGQPKKVKFTLKKLKNYVDDLKPWDVSADERALADLCLVLFNSSEFLFVY